MKFGICVEQSRIPPPQPPEGPSKHLRRWEVSTLAQSFPLTHSLRFQFPQVSFQIILNHITHNYFGTDSALNSNAKHHC